MREDVKIMRSTLFDRAVELFEMEQYYAAVEAFILSYEREEQKEKIRNILYDCFVNPNEAEFRKNYDFVSSEGPAYEELSLDFIPVSDTEYFIYDKETEQFAGIINYDSFIQCSENNRFHSALVTGIWDWRIIAEIWKEQIWSQMYIVLGEQSRRFFSFFKLPAFGEIMKKCVKIFLNTDEMREYFEKNDDVYLPKHIYGDNLEKNMKLIKAIHEERIRIPRKKENITLSVCIPTYERGHLAYDYVKQLRDLDYDSEIEIFVTNNGSNLLDPDYKKIEELAERDSRITYFRFMNNQGFAGNIHNIVKRAKGKFLLLSSDEDRIELSQIPKLLEILHKCDNVGVIKTNRVGEEKDTIFLPSGMKAITYVSDLNYLTGLILNGALLRAMEPEQKIEQVKNNMYVIMYAHLFYAMWACSISGLLLHNLELWTVRERSQEEVERDTQHEKDIVYWAQDFHPENRMKQFRGAVELVKLICGDKDSEIQHFFLHRYKRLFQMLIKLYISNPEGFCEQINWREACRYYYDKAEEIRSELRIELDRPDLLREVMEEHEESEELLRIYSNRVNK